MGYPGNVVVTASISVSASTDNYATHLSELGKGGIHSKTTLALRNLISTERREWGMSCVVSSDPTPANNGTYVLKNIALGGVNNTITDNSNWILETTGGGTWGSITGTLSSQTDLQNALNLKAPLASPTFTGTVSGITKSMVGLGNVDNTTDAAKPVSTAQQTALNLKANLASPTFTGDPKAPTPATSDNDTSIATTAFVQAVSATKQDKLSQVLTGTGVVVGTFGGVGTDNDLRAYAATYYISGFGNFSAPQTDLIDFALSAIGNVRYIGAYLTTSNTITYVQGTEGATATPPTQPANTVLYGNYILVTDAGAVGGGPPVPVITPVIITTIATSTTPTPIISNEVKNVDMLFVTTLASGSALAAPTGTLVDGKRFIVRTKDNGTARVLSYNALYKFGIDIPAQTTTIIGSTLYQLFMYNQTENRLICLASIFV